MKKEKEVASLMVSPDTGEITNAIYVGDRIVRAEVSEYLNNTEEVGKDMGFVKMFNCALEAFSKMNLPSNQWRVVHCVARYIRYDSGLVAFDNGVHLTVSHIAEITELGERAVFEAIDKLVKNKIIAKTKVGHDVKYFVNPYLFMRGIRANKTLTVMFENTKWKYNYDLDQSTHRIKSKYR